MANFPTATPQPVMCEVCGTYFETRRGLSSHARLHLRQLGVTLSENSGAPIELLYQLIQERDGCLPVFKSASSVFGPTPDTKTSQLESNTPLVQDDSNTSYGTPVRIMATSQKVDHQGSPARLKESATSILPSSPSSLRLSESSNSSFVEQQITTKPLWAPLETDAPITLGMAQLWIVLSRCSYASLGVHFWNATKLKGAQGGTVNGAGRAGGRLVGDTRLNTLIGSQNWKGIMHCLSLVGLNLLWWLACCSLSCLLYRLEVVLSIVGLFFKWIDSIQLIKISYSTHLCVNSTEKKVVSVLGTHKTNVDCEVEQMRQLWQVQVQSLLHTLYHSLICFFIFASSDTNEEVHVCQLCGAWFETRKGLASHARVHLRQIGVSDSEVKGSPVDFLYKIMEEEELKPLTAQQELTSIRSSSKRSAEVRSPAASPPSKRPKAAAAAAAPAFPESPAPSQPHPLFSSTPLNLSPMSPPANKAPKAKKGFRLAVDPLFKKPKPEPVEMELSDPPKALSSDASSPLQKSPAAVVPANPLRSGKAESCKS